MDLVLSKLSHGVVRENNSFMLVGVVKEGASGAFEDIVNVTNSREKCYILCGCQLKEEPYDTILYMSNDPNDFIYNKTSTADNYGVIPMRIKDNRLDIDLLGQNHNRTMPLPKEPKFNPNVNNQPNDYFFTSVTNKILFPNNRLQHGVAFEINLKQKERKNFYIRKNLTNGKIGSSIAWFSKPSTRFEYLKTKFYGGTGTVGNFTFESGKYNMLGVSKLVLDTNSEVFSSLPISYNTGIVKIEQGTSLWLNDFTNPSGVSDIHLKINNGNKFLNTDVFNPDITKGISIQVNIRNDKNNFTSIRSLNLPTTTEVFDYYLINLNGYTPGPLENNSSQYYDNNSDIQGGICYFLSNIYTYYNFFHQNNLKGFIHDINVINGTPIKRTSTNNELLTSRHAPEYAVFSDNYDAINAIDLNDNNNFDTNSTCGKVRNITNFKNNLCGLYLNSDKNLNNPQGQIFSDNPKINQKTYLIEIISMAILMVIYIIFAFYYYNLSLN